MTPGIALGRRARAFAESMRRVKRQVQAMLEPSRPRPASPRSGPRDRASDRLMVRPQRQGHPRRCCWSWCRSRSCWSAARSGCAAAARSAPRMPTSRPISRRSRRRCRAASSRCWCATTLRSRPATCSPSSTPSRSAWRSPRPRPNSITRAPWSRPRARNYHETRSELAEMREPGRLPGAPGAAPAGAGGKRRRLGHQARGGAERDARSRATGSMSSSSGSTACWPRSAAIRTSPTDEHPAGAREAAPSATAPRSTWSAPTITRADRRHRRQRAAAAGRAGQVGDAALCRGRRHAALGRGQHEGNRPDPREAGPEGQRRARHLSRRCLGGRGGKHQPGDRRGVRDPAAAERVRELGQGGAAPAGAGAAAAARRASRRCAPA